MEQMAIQFCKMITIELTDQEASFFIAMREAKVFELRNTDIIFYINYDGVLTEIKKPLVSEKHHFVFIYKRKKNFAFDTLS